jgi:hypothetical protein
MVRVRQQAAAGVDGDVSFLHFAEGVLDFLFEERWG